MTAALDRAVILARLRNGGRSGVAYIDLRDLLKGENAEPVLDELRARGHRIQRVPDARGRPLAILIERQPS